MNYRPDPFDQMLARTQSATPPHPPMPQGGPWPVDHALAWMVYLALLNQRNTNLILQELRRMTDSATQLSQAVTDLQTAFTGYADAHTGFEQQLLDEVANLKATVQPSTDPAITDAYSKIESLVSQMRQGTDALQSTIAAVAPAPATDTPADPTPAGASSDSPSSAPASTTDAAAGATASS